jgi:hypothetical protein
VGGVGASQLSGVVHRWLDPDTFRRLVIPLNYSLFGSNPSYAMSILVAYAICGALVAVRLLLRRFSWQWFAFLVVWCATAAAPIFQLWGLGYDLQGARFYFFLTLPLSVLLPVLLFHPDRSELMDSLNNQSASWQLERAIQIVGCTAVVVLLLLLQGAAVQTNRLWVRAGYEVRKLSQCCQKLCQSQPGDGRFLILNIPQDNAGAHMLLNGQTFNVMLQPPLISSDLSHRFLNCAPIMFSPEQYINGSQFRHMLSEKNVVGPLVWSRKSQTLVAVKYKPSDESVASPVDLSAQLAKAPIAGWQPNTFGHAQAISAGREVVFKSIVPGDGLLFQLPDINPLKYQYLQFELKGLPKGTNSGFVEWAGDIPQSKLFSNALPESAIPVGSVFAPFYTGLSSGNDKFQTVTVNLGHYWRWYASGNISSLHIALPASEQSSIRNVRLVPYACCAPALTLIQERNVPFDPYFAELRGGKAVLELETQPVSEARSLQIEISKPNYFFENFEDDRQVDPVFALVTVPISQNKLTIDTQLGSKNFPQPGFYQLRAQYLNADKQTIGQPSDSVTLYLQ